MLTITNMATMRIVGVISDKFHIVETCTSGNYAKKTV